MKNKILCAVGFHVPNNDWILKWSSKVSYCKCKHCGKFIVSGVRGSFTEQEFYQRF